MPLLLFLFDYYALSLPVMTALIRRTPAEEDCSLIIENLPSSEVLLA